MYAVPPSRGFTLLLNWYAEKNDMASNPVSKLTPEGYLELERKESFRSEYRDGEVFAISGGSRKHGLVAANLAGELSTQLRRRPCELFVADMRVRVPQANCFFYPDLAVACGEPQFAGDELDTLLNPVLLVEVLSKSTEDYDRSRKFRNYRTLASLQEYVLVHQDAIHVEHFSRQPDGSWSLREFTRLSDTVELDAINCRLKLEDVYERVAEMIQASPEA